jgi:hypothetical protein
MVIKKYTNDLWPYVDLSVFDGDMYVERTTLGKCMDSIAYNTL